MKAVRAHEARLRAVFRQAFLVSLGVPAALQACGTGGGSPTSMDGGNADSTVRPDATPQDAPAAVDASVEMGPDSVAADAAVDSGAESSVDAGPDSSTDANL